MLYLFLYVYFLYSDVSYSTTCEDQLRSTSINATESKKNLKSVNILAKLGENPLNPFSKDFLNSDFTAQDLSSWSNDSSSDSSTSSSYDSSNSDSKGSLLLNENSETLSLSHASKNSIFEFSLCYDHENESGDSDDVIFNRQFFYPKRHTLKDSSHSNKPFKDRFLEIPTAGSNVSDIRTMFNIPPDLFIDKDAAYLHLKKINKYLAWRMDLEYLDKLHRYIFYDISCPDPDHSEWSGWSCILDDTEPCRITKNLERFQKWLLSVLCILRYAESHFHNLLISNLSNILWEVNHLLEEDICSFCLPNSLNDSSVRIISDFFNLKRKNDALAWPMKFICLLKLRHCVFCKFFECPNSDWESLFYQGDESIYQINLYLFRVWIISILCEISQKNIFNQCIASNLCHVLAEVNIILQEESFQVRSSEKFFKTRRHLLTWPKNVIQFQDQKYKLLTMFHNSNPPEKIKHSSAFLKSTHQSKDEDILGFLYIQVM